MFILSQQASIANQFLAEMRDEQIQKDRLRFRKNLERLGEILAYEVSKTLTYKEQEVQTPLEKTKIQLPSDQVVLVAVLRAALPFYQGFLNFFDQAESGFIGAQHVRTAMHGCTAWNITDHTWECTEEQPEQQTGTYLFH